MTPKETKGQVLAELLIAGAILAIGLVAALFIITKSIHLMEKANGIKQLYASPDKHPDMCSIVNQ